MCSHEVCDQREVGGFAPDVYPSETAWKQAAAQSSVRLQWDPDHHPSGAKIERRAIQLGLRGEVLAQYARDWIVNIEDIWLCWVRRIYN